MTQEIVLTNAHLPLGKQPCVLRLMRLDAYLKAFSERNLMARAMRLLLLASTVLLPATLHAQELVGITVGLTPNVNGSTSGTLQVGSSVVRNETVSTGANAVAELRLNDDTHLGLGPSSRVTLDDFVVGSAKASIAMTLAKGSFRFITGSAQKSAYRIETPLAVIGVRGTVLDIIVRRSSVDVTLREGAADVCPTGQACLPLEIVGNTIRIRANGEILRGTGGVPFQIICRQVDAAGVKICTASNEGGTKPLLYDPNSGGSGASPPPPPPPPPPPRSRSCSNANCS